MKQVEPRTYEVKSPDFPIKVVIQAKNLNECIAIVSDIHVARDGQLLATIPVAVTNNKAAMTTTYPIAKPSQKAPCDLIQSLHCFFDDHAPANAKYEITITGAAADSFKTNLGLPSINPNIANLVFQLR